VARTAAALRPGVTPTRRTTSHLAARARARDLAAFSLPVFGPNRVRRCGNGAVPANAAEYARREKDAEAVSYGFASHQDACDRAPVYEVARGKQLRREVAVRVGVLVPPVLPHPLLDRTRVTRLVVVGEVFHNMNLRGNIPAAAYGSPTRRDRDLAAQPGVILAYISEHLTSSISHRGNNNRHDKLFLHVKEWARGRRGRLVRKIGALAQDRGDGRMLGHDVAGACGIGHAVHGALHGTGRPAWLSFLRPPELVWPRAGGGRGDVPAQRGRGQGRGGRGGAGAGPAAAGAGEGAGGAAGRGRGRGGGRGGRRAAAPPPAVPPPAAVPAAPAAPPSAVPPPAAVPAAPAAPPPAPAALPPWAARTGKRPAQGQGGSAQGPKRARLRADLQAPAGDDGDDGDDSGGGDAHSKRPRGDGSDDGDCPRRQSAGAAAVAAVREASRSGHGSSSGGGAASSPPARRRREARAGRWRRAPPALQPAPRA